jgi:DNA-binding NtrC family response regulator
MEADSVVADHVDYGQLSEREELAGESAAMRELRARIAAVGRVHSTVLVHGEMGTGKAAVARALHAASERRGAPFVHVHCAGIAPGSGASELFGEEAAHASGAPRRGWLERAADGTLYLDEVAELEPDVQARLARALEAGSYERARGGETFGLAARIVAATSEDPGVLVDAGKLRAELYLRLDVIELRVPPLRERLSDLPLLVESGLRRLGARLGLPASRVSEGFVERLFAHDWPGNVRELLNVLERALVHAGGRALDAGVLDGALGAGAARRRERPGRASAGEAAQIASVLRATGGNVSRAARRLGLARSTLRYRIRVHDLAHLVPED